MSEREQSGDVAAFQGEDLGDIVVTANKKAQSLQKTPAAVTALDSELIVQKGVTDLRAAQAFVPSVRFQQQATSTEVYIRGIGATLDQAQIDPPTSVNFNGIYPLLFVTMLLPVKISRWRQQAGEQAECLRCVFFTADVRWLAGLEDGVWTFGGTAAPVKSGLV